MTAGSASRADAALSASSVTVSDVACTHCGLLVPPGFLDALGEHQFCCDGCRTAFSILHEHGLDRYYGLPQRRHRPVVTTGRSYEEFDHPAFRALHVTTDQSGTSKVELYLEGVHCASCVWLVERVPLLIPGVARTELNIRRSLAVVEWRAEQVALSSIARTLDSLGYAPHPFRGVKREEMRRQEDRAFLIRIGVSGALALNVMLAALALYSGWWSGMEASYARFFRWTSLVLTVPALAFPGRVFFTSAWAALRTRTAHMDLPIAIALGAGFTRGAVNTFTDRGPIYFDGVNMLVFLLLVGRYLQQRGQRTASDAAELLYSLTPSTARIVGTDGATHEVPAEAVVPGQVLDVRAGETLAADGLVEGGTSAVNMSLLTGESRPVTVQPGDVVYAGTLNVSTALRVRVTEAGEGSRVARIIRQVEESARRRAPVVLMADRMSGWFTAAVVALAAVVYVVWLGIDGTRAMDNAIALLIVTCPCALALATPLAVTAAIGRAARAGIFIKGGEALEQLAKPARLLLDKTGTITEARTSLVEWRGEEWIKPYVLALEIESSHPIAEGFRTAWKDVPPLKASTSTHIAGGGIEGVVEGRRVLIGSPSFIQSRTALSLDPPEAPIAKPSASFASFAVNAVPAIMPSDGGLSRASTSERAFTPKDAKDAKDAEGAPLEHRLELLERSGLKGSLIASAAGGANGAGDASALTEVLVAIDGSVVGSARIGDPVRRDAASSIAGLTERGWHVGILSGDAQPVVDAVARQVGVVAQDAVGGASPEDKLAAVQAARADGAVVMVGDGVNDAAAIAASSVGVGVHGGAEACLSTADVYLTRPGLASLVELVDGSRRTMAIVRRGIAFSLAYNVLGIGFAVAGLINPLVAAILMPVSSLTVLAAAWRGRSFDATRTTSP